MAYTRRKKVTLDGAEFMIAPLTVDQVEFQMGASLDDMQKEAQSAVMNAYVLVCTGLNNAASPEDLAAEGPWVPTRPAVNPADRARRPHLAARPDHHRLSPGRDPCVQRAKGDQRPGGIQRHGSGARLDIAEIRACIITVTGWTYEQVQECPFPIALELFEYWSTGDFAPPHFVLRQIAIFLGARKPPRGASGQLTDAEQYVEATGPVVTSIPSYAQSFIQEHSGKKPRATTFFELEPLSSSPGGRLGYPRLPP